MSVDLAFDYRDNLVACYHESGSECPSLIVGLIAGKMRVDSEDDYALGFVGEEQLGFDDEDYYPEDRDLTGTALKTQRSPGRAEWSLEWLLENEPVQV